MRKLASKTVKALVLGYLEYPVLQSVTLSAPFDCDDNLDFTDIEASVNDGAGILRNPAGHETPH